jgi:acyl carrier protein
MAHSRVDVSKAMSACLAIMVLGLLLGSGCHSKSKSEEKARPVVGAVRRDDASALKPKVRIAVAEVLGMRPEDIDDDTPLSALAKPADELAVVELILTLEERFSVQIPDDAIAGGRDLGQLPDHLTVSKLAVIVARMQRQ